MHFLIVGVYFREKKVHFICIENVRKVNSQFSVPKKCNNLFFVKSHFLDAALVLVKQEHDYSQYVNIERNRKEKTDTQ